MGEIARELPEYEIWHAECGNVHASQRCYVPIVSSLNVIRELFQMVIYIILDGDTRFYTKLIFTTSTGSIMHITSRPTGFLSDFHYLNMLLR